MKLRNITLGTATLALAVTLAAPAGAAQIEPTGSDPLIIGHRGAAGVAPENTLAAIKAGSQSGAEFIEIDVQLSKDGVPFIFHDGTPSRTTNVAEVFPDRVNDPITSFTWEELQ
ncbi:glycerophosphodiester phosphodiesterase family protein, partial [Glutamicibacter sp.]